VSFQLECLLSILTCCYLLLSNRVSCCLCRIRDREWVIFPFFAIFPCVFVAQHLARQAAKMTMCFCRACQNSNSLVFILWRRECCEIKSCAVACTVHSRFIGKPAFCRYLDVSSLCSQFFALHTHRHATRAHMSKNTRAALWLRLVNDRANVGTPSL